MYLKYVFEILIFEILYNSAFQTIFTIANRQEIYVHLSLTEVSTGIIDLHYVPSTINHVLPLYIQCFYSRAFSVAASIGLLSGTLCI